MRLVSTSHAKRDLGLSATLRITSADGERFSFDKLALRSASAGCHSAAAVQASHPILPHAAGEDVKSWDHEMAHLENAEPWGTGANAGAYFLCRCRGTPRPGFRDSARSDVSGSDSGAGAGFTGPETSSSKSAGDPQNQLQRQNASR